MSKTRGGARQDKRRTQGLELFVLVLIGEGLHTPYALLAGAGLSPGATIPVLLRLEKAGLVRRDVPGSRGKGEFELTEEGRKSLRSRWQQLLISPPSTDVGPTLRTVCLAVLMGANRKLVAERLLSAAEATSEQARRRKQSVPKPQEEPGNPYRWMVSAYSASKAANDAHFLRWLARQLPKRSGTRSEGSQSRSDRIKR